MKLLIFDIDGTLTHLDGATRRAFNAAYVRLFGISITMDGLKLHGRTDPLIFRDCFDLSGLTGDYDEIFGQFREVYLQELPLSIAASAKARTLPGVSELLATLDARRDRAALALGTGNMEAGARIKIGSFGLNHYFPVGGFGDVHNHRSLIMQDAIRNSQRHYGRTFDPADIWVIGDTIHDVEGGKLVNAKTMGVATGGAFSAEELVAVGADVVFPDLSDTAAVLQAFGLD